MRSHIDLAVRLAHKETPGALTALDGGYLQRERWSFALTEFVYTIKSHPTSYKGVNFRSRLEATWAAFFDLCGWEWEYEPFDLDGWVPDFLIKGAVPTLVEVKPIDFGGLEYHQYNGFNYDSAIRKFAPKTLEFASKLDVAPGERVPFEVVLLGLGPFIDMSNPYPWGLGAWVHEMWDMGYAHSVSLCRGDKSKLDYMSIYGSFCYRYSGTYDGDHHLEMIEENDPYPMVLWNKAKNITQWKRP